MKPTHKRQDSPGLIRILILVDVVDLKILKNYTVISVFLIGTTTRILVPIKNKKFKYTLTKKIKVNNDRKTDQNIY